jgi:hypothetical protein
MYNLLVGFPEGAAFASRVVEYTDDVIQQYVAPAGRVDPSRLTNLPTLVMPELGEGASLQVARVGHIEGLTLTGRDYSFRFIPNPTIPEIAANRVQEASGPLRINEWEFSRTHWAVKDVDLYRVLHESVIAATPAPRVFRFPVEVPTEADLVAVMMPFEARFNGVYATLREAVADAGMRCYRADDIWHNDHVMDDIISLIWRARVVIADLSSKNPNVFYETGVAHTLGRDVIQIAQSIDDVPFDLRSIRSLTYLANGEGLQQLRGQVTSRLKDLVARC